MSSDIALQEPKDDHQQSACGPSHQHPRFLLPCLHSFCASCIESLKEPHESGSQAIRCPTCHEASSVEEGRLPLDYTAVARPQDDAVDQLRCDLCADPRALAKFACVDCSASVCDFCAEAHRRQTRTRAHRVLPSGAHAQAPAKRPAQVPCQKHSHEQLELFCETCATTTCRLCCSAEHRGHCCRFIADVNSRHLDRLKSTVDGLIKPLADTVGMDLARLTAAQLHLDEQARRVAEQVDRHVEQHRRTVDEHGRTLLDKVREIQQGRQRSLGLQRRRLEGTAEGLGNGIRYAERLLRHDSAAQALTLLAPVTNRLMDLSNRYQQGLTELTVSLQEPFLHFLPTDGFPVSGRVSDRHPSAVCASNCVLRAYPGLRHVVQGCNVRATLLSMDGEDRPVTEGGAIVAANLMAVDHKATGSLVPVKVHDAGDGTYTLSFRLDRCGCYDLHVQVDGSHLEGSPFPVTVRPQPSLRPHSGTYHCCAFCSSGGSKDARCACAGRMPGGYKGCGHSHIGHPGGKHWSCCGNTSRNSNCSRPVSVMYQCTI